MDEDLIKTNEKNMEISLILAKQVALKKHRQLSIPPALLEGGSKSSIKNFTLKNGVMKS